MGEPEVCVTIPAFNEEETVGEVVERCEEVLEREGYSYEIIVLDDGSTDSTAKAAEDAGASVVSHPSNQGLGSAFWDAMTEAIGTGAEVIVNIDADGQYEPREIPELVEPVENGDMDMVLGTRSVLSLEHMPLSKRVGNTIGSLVTSLLAGDYIKDAQTGFRSMSRELVMDLFLFGTYTYVQESVLQARYKGYSVGQIPASFYPRERGGSRLISSLPRYIFKAAGIVLRTYRDYRPMRAFSIISLLFFSAAFFPLYKVIEGLMSAGQTASSTETVIAAIFLASGGLTIVMGFLGEMVKREREIVEEILYEIREKDS